MSASEPKDRKGPNNNQQARDLTDGWIVSEQGLAQAQAALANFDLCSFAAADEAYREVARVGASLLAVERVSAWLFSSARDYLICAYRYQHGEFVDTELDCLEIAGLNDYFKALSQARVLAADDLAEDARVHELTPYFTTRGITAMLDVPVRVNGVCVGILGYEQVGRPRRWSSLDQVVGASLADKLGAIMASYERAELFGRPLHLRSILEHTAEPVLFADSDGRVSFINAAARRLLGLSEDEPVDGRSLAEFQPEDEYERLCGEEHEAFAATGRWQGVTVVCDSAGVETPVNVLMHRHFDVDSGRSFNSILLRDVGEQSRLARSLRETEERYHALAEQLWDAVVTIDPDTHYIVDANRGALRMLGYSYSELLQLRIDDLTSSSPELIEDNIQRIVEQGRHYIGERRYRRRDGTELEVEVGWVCRVRYNGRNLLSAVIRDLSERSRYREQINRLMVYDSATGFPNSNAFPETARQALSAAVSSEGPAAYLIVHIARFRHIAELLDVPGVDSFLRQFAERLRAAAGDTVLIGCAPARNEFVLVDSGGDAEATRRLVERIESAFEGPLEVGGRQLRVRLHIGAAICPEDGTEARELGRRAGIAMQYARQSGQSCRFYAGRAANRFADQLWLEEALRTALAEDQITLAYQPVVELTDGYPIVAAEVLARWTHPEVGPVLPGEFIQVAEDSGLIRELDRYIIAHAIQQLVVWRREGLDVRLSVNVSGQTLMDASFRRDLEAMIRDADINPEFLYFEVTETAVIANLGMVRETLQELAEAGIQVGLDDFGTGYSSLAYLKHLPVNFLKIDREFVAGIGADRRDEHTLHAVVALAQDYELRVIGEGVETRSQLEWLRAEGVDFAQGFLIARPEPADAFRARLVAPGRPSEGGMVPRDGLDRLA